MTKPTTPYPWAVNDSTYTFTYNGVEHTVPYKVAPVVGDVNHDFTDLGAIKGVGVPAQYINWQLNGAYRWILHRDGRISIGDVFETTNNLTVTQVNEQLGGGWEYIGSITKSYGEEYYWKKLF